MRWNSWCAGRGVEPVGTPGQRTKFDGALSSCGGFPPGIDADETSYDSLFSAGVRHCFVWLDAVNTFAIFIEELAEKSLPDPMSSLRDPNADRIPCAAVERFRGIAGVR